MRNKFSRFLLILSVFVVVFVVSIAPVAAQDPAFNYTPAQLLEDATTFLGDLGLFAIVAVVAIVGITMMVLRRAKGAAR